MVSNDHDRDLVPVHGGLDEPVEIEARVAWVGEDADGQRGMGLEFQALPADVRETINQLVRDLRAAR